MIDKKEAFEWVSDVMESCKTHDQITNCQNLIHAYYNMFKDLDMTECLFSFYYHKYTRLINAKIKELGI